MQTLTGNPRLAQERLSRVAIVLALSLASVVGGRSAEDEYEPLAKGMEWIMDLEVTSPQGDKTNGIYHRKIVDSVEHQGKTYFRSHTWLEEGRPFAMDYTKLVRKDADGYYSIDERDPKRFEKNTAKLPFEVGKKWA